jgi:hypothetical protein
MNSYMLTVFFLFILQHKLFLLLPHGTLKDSFSLGVVTRGKVMLLAADLIAFTVRHNSLILSATIYCTLILSQALLRVT